MAMSSFEKAFASARKSGKKEFTWNGKRYNTKVKEETASSPRARPKNVMAPKPRPTSPNSAPKSNMDKLRANVRTERKERADDRANKRLARDVRSALKRTAPKPTPQERYDAAKRKKRPGNI